MEKKKFREVITASGKKILAGKNAKNNEDLIAQVKKEEYVLHTAKPGSPFVNIKNEKGMRISEKDKKEAAVICAKYSQDWRDNKSNVEVHIFKGKDIFKDNKMKEGTFGVKKVNIIKVNKKEIEEFEKEII